MNEWKPIKTAPWDRVVLLTGKSGYIAPKDRFVINGYRQKDWHQGKWNDVTGTHLADSAWIPDYWMECPEAPK